MLNEAVCPSAEGITEINSTETNSTETNSQVVTMGAWGIKTFENDDASDWLYQLEKSHDGSVIESALQFAGDYVASPEGCEALAAAELVLALFGKPRIGLPDTALTWVERHPSLNPVSLKTAAIRAVDRVISPESELTELWADTEDFDQWQRDVADMKAQLESL